MLRFCGVLIASASLLMASISLARPQAPNEYPLGAPVFAADGIKVGEVTDASQDDAGRIDQLRVTTGVRMGLGERQILIQRPAFIIKRAKVTLTDLSSEDVQAFPDAPIALGNARDEAR